jgi:hypothetical protein
MTTGRRGRLKAYCDGRAGRTRQPRGGSAYSDSVKRGVFASRRSVWQRIRRERLCRVERELLELDRIRQGLRQCKIADPRVIAIMGGSYGGYAPCFKPVGSPSLCSSRKGRMIRGSNSPRRTRCSKPSRKRASPSRICYGAHLLYPDEGHGFARPENNIAFRAVAENFLARHLGGRAEPIHPKN